MTRRVLNVGGNSRRIPIPAHFSGWEHHLLDIDPAGAPDIVCDARELQALPAASYDAVYCSHNLEHYFRHDLPRVLAGFLHVLKPDGFADIRVPDMLAHLGRDQPCGGVGGFRHKTRTLTLLRDQGTKGPRVRGTGLERHLLID